MRRVALAAVLVCAARTLGGTADTSVRVWEDRIELPTYTEGAPNPNPPFDLFSLTRVNYPYTIRDPLSDRPVPQRGGALHLENPCLVVTGLPAPAGHSHIAPP